MQSLTNREQLFVALGAAIGSNCVPCVESIIPKAKGAGIEDWELRLAVNSADFVRQKPAAKVLSTAKALIGGSEDDDLTVGACPLDQMEGPPASQVTETTQSDSRCCG
jgi:4-carboxymuconolactone decarboxylase